MIPASSVKTGMMLKLEKNLYKVLSAEYHMGGGKMGGLVHVKLKDLKSELFLEKKFKPDERVESVELDRKTMQFLYKDADGYYMMDLDTYDQIPLDPHLLEDFDSFLQPNMRLSVEFLEGEPVNVLFPEWVELEVISTPSGLSTLQDEVYKSATLSNGMEILVAQFIKAGDVIKVSVSSKNVYGTGKAIGYRTNMLFKRIPSGPCRYRALPPARHSH